MEAPSERLDQIRCKGDSVDWWLRMLLCGLDPPDPESSSIVCCQYDRGYGLLLLKSCFLIYRVGVVLTFIMKMKGDDTCKALGTGLGI